MRAPDGCDTAALATRLAAQGVLIEPGHPFFAAPDAPRGFYRLAYSSIPAARIAEGVALIAAAL
jgi:GntR family transcriptional regulator/MocR family aminotransferase